MYIMYIDFRTKKVVLYVHTAIGQYKISQSTRMPH